MKKTLPIIGIIMFLLINVNTAQADLSDIVPNLGTQATPTPTQTETTPTPTPSTQTTPTPTEKPTVTPTPTTITPTPTTVQVTPTATPTQTPITPTPTESAPTNISSNSTDNNSKPPTTGVVQAAIVVEKILGVSTSKKEIKKNPSIITAPIDLITKQFAKEYYADESLSRTASQRLLFLSLMFMISGLGTLNPSVVSRLTNRLSILIKEGDLLTRFRYVTNIFF